MAPPGQMADDIMYNTWMYPEHSREFYGFDPDGCDGGWGPDDDEGLEGGDEFEDDDEFESSEEDPSGLREERRYEIDHIYNIPGNHHLNFMMPNPGPQEPPPPSLKKNAEVNLDLGPETYCKLCERQFTSAGSQNSHSRDNYEHRRREDLVARGIMKQEVIEERYAARLAAAQARRGPQQPQQPQPQEQQPQQQEQQPQLQQEKEEEVNPHKRQRTMGPAAAHEQLKQQCRAQAEALLSTIHDPGAPVPERIRALINFTKPQATLYWRWDQSWFALDSNCYDLGVPFEALQLDTVLLPEQKQVYLVSRCCWSGCPMLKDGHGEGQGREVAAAGEGKGVQQQQQELPQPREEQQQGKKRQRKQEQDDDDEAIYGELLRGLRSSQEEAASRGPNRSARSPSPGLAPAAQPAASPRPSNLPGQGQSEGGGVALTPELSAGLPAPVAGASVITAPPGGGGVTVGGLLEGLATMPKRCGFPHLIADIVQGVKRQDVWVVEPAAL